MGFGVRCGRAAKLWTRNIETSPDLGPGTYLAHEELTVKPCEEDKPFGLKSPRFQPLPKEHRELRATHLGPGSYSGHEDWEEKPSYKAFGVQSTRFKPGLTF